MKVEQKCPLQKYDHSKDVSGWYATRQFVLEIIFSMFTMLLHNLLKTVFILASVGFSHAANSTTNQIVTYPIPAGVTTSSAFNVSVKNSNGSWTDLQSYLVALNEVNTTSGSGIAKASSMAYFDFSGSVDVSVTYNKGRIDSARIRPSSLNLAPRIDGENQVSFTLAKPQNLIVEVNNDIFDCMHLLSNDIESEILPADDPNVVYFGPGLHTVPGNVVNVTSNQTVYIAGGGVLNAGLSFQNVTNSNIRGHGVVWHASSTILVEYSSAITISDIIVLNPRWYTVSAGEVDGLSITNVRSFSAAGNADGIDLFCSKNVLIDGVFMRNSDDNIAIYSHRWTYYGDSNNITVQNSILWADVAHPVNIGTHGNTESPETINNIVFKNIDILDHREPQVDYQGCISLNPGDDNLIQNVHISDIRVEDFRLGQLVNMRVMYNTKYNTSPGRGIVNVTIKDLAYSGIRASSSTIVGYNEERNISGVTFQNLTINGKLISDSMQKPSWYKTSDYVPLYVNEHVKDLKFI